MTTRQTKDTSGSKGTSLIHGSVLRKKPQQMIQLCLHQYVQQVRLVAHPTPTAQAFARHTLKCNNIN